MSKTTPSSARNSSSLPSPTDNRSTMRISSLTRTAPIKDMAGLKGKKFAFTDPKSNTGAIVPTYMVAKEFNVKPEKFFGEVIFTKSHDRSIEAVAKKIVDGASIDSLIYDYAAKKNPAYTSQTKIIKKSPAYGIPPLVVKKDMDPALKNKIRNILLNMHTDPAGQGDSRRDHGGQVHRSQGFRLQFRA